MQLHFFSLAIYLRKGIKGGPGLFILLTHPKLNMQLSDSNGEDSVHLKMVVLEM